MHFKILIVAALLVVSTSLVGCATVMDRLLIDPLVGGDFVSEDPRDMAREPDRDLRNTMQAVVRQAALALPATGYADHHVHVLSHHPEHHDASLPKPTTYRIESDLCGGMTMDRTSYINPDRFKLFNVVKYFKTRGTMSAARIRTDDPALADYQFAKRLLDLTTHMRDRIRHHRQVAWGSTQAGQGGAGAGAPIPLRFYLLAMDGVYDADGRMDLQETDIYVSNQYVLDLTRCLNKRVGESLFVPVISINPARQDARQELKRMAAQKARFIKWLPNAMGIDPTGKRAKALYPLIRAAGMTIITHTGREKTLYGAENHALANPELLQEALKADVRVVVAHMGRTDEKGWDSHFKTVSQMLSEPRYRCRLYGDISALLISTRPKGDPAACTVDGVKKPHCTTLEYLERIAGGGVFNGRLIHGSDYPLPAVKFLRKTDELRDRGWLTPSAACTPRDSPETCSAKVEAALNGIYSYNPLLFEFVTKTQITTARGKLAPAIYSDMEHLEAAWNMEACPPYEADKARLNALMQEKR